MNMMGAKSASAKTAPRGATPNPPAIVPAIKPTDAKKKLSCNGMTAHGSIIFMKLFEKATRFWKTYQWELTIAFIVIVVALLSYGLGYTSAKESARTPIVIEKNSSE